MPENFCVLKQVFHFHITVYTHLYSLYRLYHRTDGCGSRDVTHKSCLGLIQSEYLEIFKLKEQEIYSSATCTIESENVRLNYNTIVRLNSQFSLFI